MIARLAWVGMGFAYSKGMNNKLKDEVLNSNSVHYFTKDIIKQGLTKDPVDAYYDCKLALEVLKEHMDQVLKG